MNDVARFGHYGSSVVIDESLFIYQYCMFVFLVGCLAYAGARYHRMWRRGAVVLPRGVPLQSVFVVDDTVTVFPTQTASLLAMARGDEVVEFYQFSPEYATALNKSLATYCVRGNHARRNCWGKLNSWLDSFLDFEVDSYLVEPGPDAFFGRSEPFTCAPLDVTSPFVYSDPVYEPGFGGWCSKILDKCVELVSCQRTRFHYTCKVVYDSTRQVQLVRMERSDVAIHSVPVGYLSLVRGHYSVKEYVNEVHRVAFSSVRYENVDLSMSEMYNFVYRTDATVKGIGMGSIEHNGGKLGVEQITKIAPFIHHFVTNYKGLLNGRPIRTRDKPLPPPVIQTQFVDPLLSVVECDRVIAQYLFDEASVPLDVPKAVIYRDKYAEFLANEVRLEVPRAGSEARCSKDRLFDLPAVAKSHPHCQPREGSVVPLKVLLNEFLDLVLPGDMKHSVVLQDYAEVFARQTRPNQVANRVEAQHDLFAPGDEQVMLKNEPAKFGGVGRIVNVFTPPLSAAQGSLYGALGTVLKKCKHYGFLPPSELQDAMSEISLSHEKAVTDFSKMDATVNELLRWIEECFIKAAMRPEQLQLALEIFASTHDFTARGKCGTKFKIGKTRASGANDTSTMNTFLCIFFIWLAARHYGFSSKEAWELAYLCGGDDAAIAKISAASLDYASRFLGFDVKTTVVPLFGTFDFLSKFYVHSSAVDGFLMPDPLRTLISFTVTQIVDVPSHQVAYRKGESFLKTWGHEIPILSNIARYFVRRVKKDSKYDAACLDAVGYYERYYKDSTQAFNANQYVCPDAAAAFVIKSLGLGGTAELIAIESLYDAAMSDADLSKLKWCAVDATTTDYVQLLGHDYYSPPGVKLETITPRLPEDNQVNENGKKETSSKTCGTQATGTGKAEPSGSKNSCSRAKSSPHDLNDKSSETSSSGGSSGPNHY